MKLGIKMEERPSWDEYFLQIAALIATRSPDPNTKNGCVIVRDNNIIATGYNGFLSGIDSSNFPTFREPTEQFPLAKYPCFIHDLPNALSQACRRGVSTDGATLYSLNMPCVNCLSLAWQAGIKEFVFSKGRTGSVSGKSSFGLDDPNSKPYYDLILQATKDQLIIREV